MSEYKENPKTKNSGIYSAIPQKGVCPMKCPDCFFQSGRSYLEPLEDNLPNIPDVEQHKYNIIRVNDGNDSNNQQELVMESVSDFPLKFYNTSMPKNLDKFDAPVVLTLNPAGMTDERIHLVDPIPPQLMYVRVRVNTWNLHLVDQAIEHYTKHDVPVVLTFMAYFNESVPEDHQHNYVFRKRTTNSYWAITTEAWENVMARYKYNPYVHSCGKIEGEMGTTKCRHCGNCHREFFVTMERMRNTQ